MDRIVVFSKRERLLFVSHEGGVSTFRVNEDGSLSPGPGSPFGRGGLGELAVIESRHSTFVYAAERALDRIRGFRVEGAALSELPDSPYPAADGVHSMAQTESAFYCLDGKKAQTITGYRVAEGGAVTEVPGSPFRVAGLETAILTLAIEPRGRFLYGIDSFDSRIHGFRVLRPGGELRRLAGSPFRAIRGPESQVLDEGIVFDARGLGFAVGGAPSSTIDIQAMRLLPYGALRAVGKARSLDDRVGSAAVDPSGRYLLIGGIEGGRLSSYRIQPQGRGFKLVDERSISENSGSPRPHGIAFAQF